MRPDDDKVVSQSRRAAAALFSRSTPTKPIVFLFGDSFGEGRFMNRIATAARSLARLFVLLLLCVALCAGVVQPVIVQIRRAAADAQGRAG